MALEGEGAEFRLRLERVADLQSFKLHVEGIDESIMKFLMDQYLARRLAPLTVESCDSLNNSGSSRRDIGILANDDGII
ncbi:hypothetical protein GCM10027033_29710 [Leucobacter ruminantium]